MAEAGADKAQRSGAAYMTRERLGVSLLFLMNGFMIGAWAPKFRNLPRGLGLMRRRWG